MTHPHSFRLLTTFLIVAVVWFGWQIGQTSRVPLVIPVTVVVLSGTPVAGDPASEGFEPTMLAWVAGTTTAVPSPTRPPRPTVTPRQSCTSDLPAGTACSPATAAPTPMPTYPTAEVQTPLPTWPGVDLATPGVHYQMGKSDE